MNSFVNTTCSEQRVLIIEDDQAISTFLQKTIELQGMATSVALTGAQALARASQGGISLMTVDYSLPDMTGEELIFSLRAAGLDIPFIMITGRGDKDLAGSSMKLGARDYLVKTDDLFDQVPRVVTEILQKLAAEEQAKAAHAALTELEKKFSRVFDNSNEGILLLDDTLSILDINPKGLLFLEYASKDELALQGVEKIFSPEIVESIRVLQAKKNENHADRFETVLQTGNGGFFLADIVSSSFTANDRQYVLLNFRDISDRIRNLETVRKAAEEWQVTFDSITDLVSVHDREMGIVKVNKAFADFVGLPHSEIVGRKCYELLHPGGLTFASCPHRRTIQQGIVVTEEIDDPDIGIPLLVTTSPVFDAHGGVTGAVHIAKDISSLKKIHNELREREQFLGNILDSIQDGITILDTEFRIVRMNRFMQEKYAARMPLNGKHCYDVFQDRTEPCERCPARRTYETREPSSEILSFRTPDRKVCGWMEVFTFPLLESGTGDLKGVVEFMRDITLRREMEQFLLESEEKYRQLFDGAIDGIVVAEMETACVVDCNRAAEVLFGKEKDEMVGTKLDAYFPTEEQAAIFFQAVHEQQSVTTDALIQTQIAQKEGVVRDVSIRANTVEYHGKTFINCAFRDITEPKKMRERLKQAQKLESIGTLAGGIAHDFNNILTAIMGFSDIVKTDLQAERTPELEDVKGIIEAAHRASELVKQVLTFSRQSELERRPVYFTPIVKETVRFLRASLPSTITIEQKVDSVFHPVFADPVQLHQVIMNLCTNANHAMREKGGTLSILLEEVTLTEDQFGTRQLSPGEYVRLSVSDTGHGMDEITQARIFDPFFTTKSRDGGTGLGLSVVHGIVLSHEGMISVYSQPGIGTTFRVYLPVLKEDMGVVAKQDESDISPRGSERILLVDDEKSIAETGKRMLSRLGYDVTACTDSMQCLEIFRNAPDRFDLVLTDLTMPNITGLELAREIKAISPGTPVILMTGFANALNENNLAEHCLDYLVKKPVLKKDISSAIRSLLDSGRKKNV